MEGCFAHRVRFLGMTFVDSPLLSSAGRQRTARAASIRKPKGIDIDD